MLQVSCILWMFSLLCCRVSFLFPRTRSLLVSLPFSVDTGVSLDRCPFKYRTSVRQTGQVSCFKFSMLTTSTICSFTFVYSQTHSLEARLWEVSQPFPHFQKESVACLLFGFVSRFALEYPLAANVGPKHNNIDIF